MKKLGFGLMRLPLLDASDTTSIDIEQVKVMVDHFLSAGFTYFDTAAPYHKGMSEVAFRKAVVERYPRSAYTVTDKLSLFAIDKAEDIPGFFQGQMDRLGLDQLDYYWLHSMDADALEKAEAFHAFDFMKELKAQGKVKHIGFSFHDKAEVLDEILSKHPEMEYVQLQINYIDWEDKEVQSRRCYETALKYGKPVIVMEPVKGGSLTGISDKAVALFHEQDSQASVASWAIRFAASPSDVMVVLSGMSDVSQVDDNISFMKEFKPLDEQEQQVVKKVVDIVEHDVAVPCTACRYCVDTCPEKICIPDYFTLLNTLKRFGGARRANLKGKYAKLAESHGKASSCLKCGKCERLCPQHLPIREKLTLVSKEFE